MILDGKNGQLPVAHALHRVVVKVYMAHLQPINDAIRVKGIAVILGGDIHTPVA
jgi:hypothetical protein